VSLDLGALAERAPLKRVLEPAEVARALLAMAFDMPGLTGRASSSTTVRPKSVERDPPLRSPDPPIPWP
jgi:hypothetical protein